MTLSEELLVKLACPACKGKLEYQEKEDRLICHSCRLMYPVVDNIPVLLTDEAKKL